MLNITNAEQKTFSVDEIKLFFVENKFVSYTDVFYYKWD